MESGNVGLELHMLGLVVHDMARSVEFYRRLGLSIPEGSERKSHVEVKMGSGLTFFLDSRPSRWDTQSPDPKPSAPANASDGYRTILEFYLKTRAAVDAKSADLIALGYTPHRAPYEAPIGMYFAFLQDPDGYSILLSANLERAVSPGAAP